MAHRLFHDALIGVDDENCCVSIGGAGNHVAEELLVTWSINYYIFSFWRLKIDLSSINGYPFCALFFKGIEDKGKLGFLFEVMKRP